VIARVNARAAAVAWILQEAAVLIAFRFAAIVLDFATAAARVTARFGVDHAAARRAAAATVGQAALNVNALAVTAAARTAAAGPSQRAGHDDESDRQNGLSGNPLQTSLDHDSGLLNSHFASLP
jgi:hypothetical protein